MSDLIGLLMSFAFVFIIIVVSSILTKLKILNEEGSRKFIHIGVSNWWIIAMIYFEHYIFASIVPLAFIIINYISYRYKIISAMERHDDQNLGTVYFPISLLLLVIFSFGLIDKPYIGAIGILIMGYGDGLAAVLGKKFGKRKLFQNKTIVGSVMMFIVSFIISMSILSFYNPVNFIYNAIIISLIATGLELFSKKGLDNLTVPILTSLFFYFFLLN